VCNFGREHFPHTCVDLWCFVIPNKCSICRYSIGLLS
jgi:hypothetical protein